MSHRSRSTARIFLWPAAIALLCALGLFAALLGDGAWDMLAWLGLGLPAALSLRAMIR
ncbi:MULTISPECIES: hypothetical protein [Pseudomonas]|jgi:hypothetical protein|uniref:DUF4175 domain-containing protein n=1 Tax=Pseudomonas promysalinigenes TaxID=485898 RepID=A0ABY6AMS2_9PSED|nr:MULTISPECIES: hypothetical protein [Pseudomonas]QXI34121.1 hypothetical protein HU725_001740 [Pseudomonas promysalinigenes]UXH40357.1 hypothetical protein N5C08_02025 [Pseudomonas promysalinigenes]